MNNGNTIFYLLLQFQSSPSKKTTAERNRILPVFSLCLIGKGSLHEIVLVHGLLLFRFFGSFRLFGCILTHVEIHCKRAKAQCQKISTKGNCV